MKEFKLLPADILLPKDHFENWAVIACDQFTSDEAYWEQTKATAGDGLSAYHLVLPEIYLGKQEEERIQKINESMQKYVNSGELELLEQSMIYVERQTTGGLRKGIVGLINLDDYDYRKGSSALIRATEETVIERIPPRVRIRKDASLELPHVMLLIDDPEQTVIEPLAAQKEQMKKAYDFDLMQNGGHIAGYVVQNDECARIGEALECLAENNDFLFAVGDGNHSLATAKECAALSTSPKAKYALVEVVNIHDASLQFEPIYRVLFGVEPQAFLSEIKAAFSPAQENAHQFTCLWKDGETVLSFAPKAELPVGTLQPFLDDYLKKHPHVSIDYIHGEDEVKRLCKQENTVGFLFCGMGKRDLFPAVARDGALPRKTFSMGHSVDKRYYLECRTIR